MARTLFSAQQQYSAVVKTRVTSPHKRVVAVMLFEDIDCMKSSNARVPSNASPNDGTQTQNEKENAAQRNGVAFPAC